MEELSGDFAAQSAPAAQGRGDGARSGRTGLGGSDTGGLPVQGQEPKGAVWSLYTVWG